MIFEEIKKQKKANLDEHLPLSDRLNCLAEIRQNVAKAQECAQRMLAANNKQINAIEVGDLVLFRVHPVDRGPSDPNNLLCYVVAKRHGLFQLASKLVCS